MSNPREPFLTKLGQRALSGRIHARCAEDGCKRCLTCSSFMCKARKPRVEQRQSRCADHRR